MSHEVSALGVMLDLTHAKSGALFVSNTEKRKADLVTLMGETLARGSLTSNGDPEADQRPRCSCDVPSAQRSYPRSHQSCPGRIACAAPRTVDTLTGEMFFVFTDACFESEAKAGGIVEFLLVRKAPELVWRRGRPLSMRFLIMPENQEQAIGELEAFALCWFEAVGEVASFSTRCMLRGQ